MKRLSQLAQLKKSWTMYSAALLLAAPELLAFLPSVKANLPVVLYDWVFRAVILLFVILRVKTQVQK